MAARFRTALLSSIVNVGGVERRFDNDMTTLFNINTGLATIFRIIAILLLITHYWTLPIIKGRKLCPITKHIYLRDSRAQLL